MLEEVKLKKLAKLARIEIIPEEERKMLKILNEEIIGVKSIYDIDTTNLDRLINPIEMYLSSEKDEVKDGDKREDLEKCSPKFMYGYYVVPKIIEN